MHATKGTSWGRVWGISRLRLAGDEAQVTWIDRNFWHSKAMAHGVLPTAARTSRITEHRRYSFLRLALIVVAEGGWIIRPTSAGHGRSWLSPSRNRPSATVTRPGYVSIPSQTNSIAGSASGRSAKRQIPPPFLHVYLVRARGHLPPEDTSLNTRRAYE